MRKILYIITQSEFGGAQKNVLDLAARLKDSYDILVAVGADGSGGFFDWLEEKNVRFVKLHWLRRSDFNPIADLFGLWEIFRLIKKERPDIVHLHSSKAGFSGSIAAKVLGVKVVYTVHGAVFEAAFWAPTRKFYLWLEKFSARFKNKIICVSQNDKRLWLKYKAAPEKKLVVIHNGIDYYNLNFFPKDEAREKIFGLCAPLFEAARGSGTNLKIVGAIANLYPEKGLSYLIQAAAQVTKNYQNVIFVVIGEGLERPLLEEMIKEYQVGAKFILAGAINEAWRYLKAFDIFMLPSIKEGLPYTILEAMAAGLPIVASYVGGVPEMVKDKENGFLVLPKNAQILADRISELIENSQLAQQFVEASKQKIQEFSLEKMISETEKIYQNL